ncbi:transposase, partial [Streptomyces sp. AS58]
MHLDEGVLTALEKAAAEAERVRSKGAAATNKRGRRPKAIPSEMSDIASGVGGNSG